MINNDEAEPSARHRIPAIDRMMDLLEVLEQRPGGTSMTELVDFVGVPRSTVYRLLNSLETHQMVSRIGGSAFRLGPRMLRFAANIGIDTSGFDLAALATPHLEKLARTSGEGSRIAVLDNGMTLVLATAQGTREYALAAIAGQHLPLHAGAASKILLSGMAAPERDAVLAQPLAAYTDVTFTDPALLRVELDQIRRKGWSHDAGEFSPNVHSFGAPVHDANNGVIAAISTAFLAGKPDREAETIRRLVISAAEAIGAEILAATPRRGATAAKPA